MVLHALAYACPRCRGALDAAADRYRCTACEAEYPVIAGLPDFRIAPDPWIGLEADRAKGMRLEAETAGLGFAETVRAYWAMTPDTPRPLAERFIAHVLDAERRSAQWLAAIGALAGPLPGECWLDLGCGTADLAAAAAPEGEIVGLDIAFRWLVAARRRLSERGRPINLVCGNAEALPFPAESFDRVVALGTLEHCPDLARVLGEARRVLRRGGRLHARTINRYSALPEPHVGLLGVGWLPRHWADAYVRRRTGARYLHHWPRSARELDRAMRRAGFRDTRVEAAPLLDAEAARLPGWLSGLLPFYRRLRRAPVAAAAFRWLGPMLEVEGVAR